jgi:hypothetical protein
LILFASALESAPQCCVAVDVAKQHQARKTTLGIRLRSDAEDPSTRYRAPIQGGFMEDRSLELDATTLPQESSSDSQKTLELIEELGRDLDALDEAQPPRGGFFKFVRRQFFRGAKN